MRQQAAMPFHGQQPHPDGAPPSAGAGQLPVETPGSPQGAVPFESPHRRLLTQLVEAADPVAWAKANLPDSSAVSKADLARMCGIVEALEAALAMPNRDAHQRVDLAWRVLHPDREID